jgi:hypothetical protein
VTFWAGMEQLEGFDGGWDPGDTAQMTDRRVLWRVGSLHAAFLSLGLVGLTRVTLPVLDTWLWGDQGEGFASWPRHTLYLGQDGLTSPSGRCLLVSLRTKTHVVVVSVNQWCQGGDFWFARPPLF